MHYNAEKNVEVNGVRLHYAEAGQGHPALLLHGNGEDHDLLHVEMTQLVEAGYHVYAPDSRGHGANKPLNEYHYSDMAEDMYAMIRVLGLEKPALYGHSDGGIIGLLLELRHPGTLSALAVSGTNLSPEGLLPSFLEECRESNAQIPDPLVTLMLTEPHMDLQELAGIRIPVLVTAGENDLVLREETERIAAAIPDCRMEILAGEDHGSYVADSPVMGELLLRFFSHGREDNRMLLG